MKLPGHEISCFRTSHNTKSGVELVCAQNEMKYLKVVLKVIGVSVHPSAAMTV